MSVVARVRGATVIGIRGWPVTVEASLSSGRPGLDLVGVPDSAAPQIRDRVRAALINSGLPLPDRHVTVSMYPVALPKRGSGLDLAVAAAVLAAADPATASVVAEVMFIGEAQLDGGVRPVRGVLPAVLAAAQAGITTAVVPAATAQEASLVEGITIVPVTTLSELPALVAGWGAGGAAGAPHGRHTTEPTAEVQAPSVQPGDGRPLDLADVRGNHTARLALEVCAAGGHHLALSGQPGSGITMLAERFPTILPPPDGDAALEVAAMHSCAGRPLPALPERRVLISPHHSTSPGGMAGGGSGGLVIPGAAALAHHGVLFLDRAGEFSTPSLDVVRAAMTHREVTVRCGTTAITLPARFQLVVSLDTCPCPSEQVCACSPPTPWSDRTRIAGLLDRISVHASTHAPPAGRSCASPGAGESSAEVADRVLCARERAAARWADAPWRTNAEVPEPYLRRVAVPPEALEPVDKAIASTAAWLSSRHLTDLIRVAWTLADLRGADQPTGLDLTTALALKSWAPR